MVVYHAAFDVSYFLGIDIPLMFDSTFNVIRDCFAGAFIFISGIVTRYSRDNLKRGAQCFFIAMLITFVTAFVTPEAPVTFGILHLLGCSMLLFGLFREQLDLLCPKLGFAISAILFALTYNLRFGFFGITEQLSVKLPSALVGNGLLFPLGIITRDYAALDYFPLLPWLFIFICGAYYGIRVRRGRAADFIYKKHAVLFGAIGRKSLLIYLLHQPLIMAVILAVKSLTRR